MRKRLFGQTKCQCSKVLIIVWVVGQNKGTPHTLSAKKVVPP
jgi:hypothetical protein